jgi:predicted RNA-binding protein (virulence factor B family)
MAEHSTLCPGIVVELRVDRLSPVGAFLDAGTGNMDDDILLHKNQQTRPLKKDEIVEVYLYLDNQDRLTASMHLPKLREGEAGWVAVRSIGRIGAFVDIGTEKDVLLPYGEMTEPRPRRGEEVLVLLYTDKSGRLAATMDVEEWIRNNYRSAKGAVERGDKVLVRPYFISDRGISAVTQGWHWGYIPGGHLSPSIERGKQLEATVTKIDPDGRMLLSISGDKAQNRITDSEKIEGYLRERKGQMPYSDDSPPEVIMEKFGMSKAAFKRALGKLMSEGKVEQRAGWTTLKDK